MCENWMFQMFKVQIDSGILDELLVLGAEEIRHGHLHVVAQTQAP